MSSSNRARWLPPNNSAHRWTSIVTASFMTWCGTWAHAPRAGAEELLQRRPAFVSVRVHYGNGELLIAHSLDTDRGSPTLTRLLHSHGSFPHISVPGTLSAANTPSPRFRATMVGVDSGPLMASKYVQFTNRTRKWSLNALPRESVHVAGIGCLADAPLPMREQRKPLVQLSVFNMARLPSTILTDAEAEASEVYRAAGLRLVWSDSVADADSDATTSCGPRIDLRVIIVEGLAERRLIEDGHLGPAVLGFAPTKRNCFCGRNAYVFAERIMRIGYRHGNPTSLLGRVIAHEIGHLLLSSNSHSRAGIMRATLNTEPSFQPRFTSNDVKALMRGLSRLQTYQMVDRRTSRP